MATVAQEGLGAVTAIAQHMELPPGGYLRPQVHQAPPHQRHQIGRLGRFDGLPGGGEQALGLDATVAVAAVVGAPVLLLAVPGRYAGP